MRDRERRPIYVRSRADGVPMALGAHLHYGKRPARRCKTLVVAILIAAIGAGFRRLTR